MKEIWKDVENYIGIYQVSNLGNVRSLCFGPRNTSKSHIVRNLKPCISSAGYYKVDLVKDGISKTHYIHRLVASAFIPNPELKSQVNHKDGNKHNNLASNLEWVTSKENLSHAVKTGLKSPCPNYGNIGPKNSCSKTIYQFDKDGNLIAKWIGIAEAARHFNCSASSISNCLAGRKKFCKGFSWKYHI